MCGFAFPGMALNQARDQARIQAPVALARTENEDATRHAIQYHGEIPVPPLTWIYDGQARRCQQTHEQMFRVRMQEHQEHHNDYLTALCNPPPTPAVSGTQP